MPLRFDPLDAGTRRDPYPVYSELRRLDPVHEMSGGGFAFSRYDDIRFALARPDLFSSSAMRELIFRANDDQTVEDPTETLLGSDPPNHTALRKLVNRGFSRRRVAELETRVRTIAASLADDLAECDRFDLIGDFAAPLTVRVIAELLGVDPDRHEDFRLWSDALILLASGMPTGEELVRARVQKQALSEYLNAIIEARRRKPQNDLISALVRLESADGPLGPNEVDFLPNLLLIAGNETTTHLIGNLMSALFDHPAQMDLLSARPDLVPGAIEEGLRFDSPIQLVLRTTTKKVEIRGTSILAGRTIALLIGSGNRDEHVFARADRFDVTRAAIAHLGFGQGTHFCLGAPLARLEARIAVETLLPMGLRALGQSGGRIASLLVRGTDSFWVERNVSRRQVG